MRDFRKLKVFHRHIKCEVGSIQIVRHTERTRSSQKIRSEIQVLYVDCWASLDLRAYFLFFLIIFIMALLLLLGNKSVHNYVFILWEPTISRLWTFKETLNLKTV